MITSEDLPATIDLGSSLQRESQGTIPDSTFYGRQIGHRHRLSGGTSFGSITAAGDRNQYRFPFKNGDLEEFLYVVAQRLCIVRERPEVVHTRLDHFADQVARLAECLRAV